MYFKKNLTELIMKIKLQQELELVLKFTSSNLKMKL